LGLNLSVDEWIGGGRVALNAWELKTKILYFRGIEELVIF
jgi:hypothetical protein